MTFKINNERASNNLFSFIGSTTNYTSINTFENAYKSLISEYFSKPEFSMQSEIDVSNLVSFKNWASTAIENKSKVYPLIISKILKGDIFALSVYDNLHQIEHNAQLILDYSKIHSDRLLMAKFNDYGSAEDSRALLTAEHWLKSQEAAEIMEKYEKGTEALCSVTGMLHINNEYVDC